MEALWRIAERHNLPIIEDAAQSFGAEYQNKRAGTLGAFGCFSFYPTKILNACGDAGMVVTNDPDWAAKMNALRVHGMEVRYEHKYLGWNARLDAVQAAILRVKLKQVDSWIDSRRQAAQRYDEMIEENHLSQFLTRPVVRPNRRHVYGNYVVRVANGQRDSLMRHFKADHIGCDIYYPTALHQQECLQHLGYQTGDFRAAEEACGSVLALPMFPGITDDQQARVMQSCVNFLRQRVRLAA
jgi:dTDP-4-amino-4,6-dideoxygalactose transaminase